MSCLPGLRPADEAGLWLCCLLVCLGLNVYVAVEMGSNAEMVGFWVGLDGPLSADISGSFVCSLAGYRPVAL
ncbi:hypothetical protein Nepgr_006686 [Nepenthes gracilis]|uniref:Uncharacterized protein n=1 Tax=Nepenthes gracilis TaxID=150966 RepID=A0AAD3XHU4_NEPGR|nr:hypothetical protein Nepgr_006686 [Nepenthes gracilis]